MAFIVGSSTYALQMIDPFEAVRLIKESGYQAVEVCVREGWPTAPPHFPREQQGDLGKLCEYLGFPSLYCLAALMSVCLSLIGWPWMTLQNRSLKWHIGCISMILQFS